jgi:hypothetical protein
VNDKRSEFEELRQLWALLIAADALDTPITHYTINPSHTTTIPPQLAIEEMFAAYDRPLGRLDSRVRTAFRLRLMELSRQITDQVYSPSARPNLQILSDLQSMLPKLEEEFAVRLSTSGPLFS